MPLLALFNGENIYQIKNLEGILQELKADVELRRAVITEQKSYLMIDRVMNRLVKRGFMVIAEKPDPSEDLDLAIRRFGKILQKEFPEDWKQTKVEWRKKDG